MRERDRRRESFVLYATRLNYSPLANDLIVHFTHFSFNPLNEKTKNEFQGIWAAKCNNNSAFVVGP